MKMRAAVFLFAILLVSFTVAQNARRDSANDEEDEEFAYDPDEFEGFKPAADSHSSSSSDSGNSRSSTPSDSSFRPRTWRDFPGEIASVVVCVIFIINYFVGRKLNLDLATIWYQGAMSEFEKNFSLLGSGDTSEPNMWKESVNLFQFYASGRVNCESCNVKIDLCSRQDLFAVIMNFFKPQKDTVEMDILMPDDSLDSISFAIISRREEASIRKEHVDLEKLTKKVGMSEISDSLSVFSDSPFVAESLLSSHTLHTLSSHAPFIRYIKVSDYAFGTLSAPRKGIRASLYLNPKERGGRAARVAGITALTHLIIGLIDRATAIKLNTKEKEKCKAARAQMLLDDFKQNSKAREEENARRKKEAMEKMTKEEQAKLNEKMAKKEQKKASKMFRVMKLKG